MIRGSETSGLYAVFISSIILILNTCKIFYNKVIILCRSLHKIED